MITSFISIVVYLSIRRVKFIFSQNVPSYHFRRRCSHFLSLFLYFHLYSLLLTSLFLSLYHSTSSLAHYPAALQSISKSDDARPARRRRRLLYLLLIVLSALAFQSVPSLRRNRQLFTGTWSRSLQPGPPSGDR